MAIFLNIAILFMKLIYAVLKMFPTKDKIVFISRQDNNPTKDIELLSKALSQDLPNYQIVVLTRKLEFGIVNAIEYSFHIVKQMYHIATSKIVILDSYCIPVSLLNHKKGLVVIQMWHAIGLMKKAGYSILDKDEGSSTFIASKMKMHNNYDYVFTSSDSCKEAFSQVFNLPIEKFVVMPLPRIDLLRDEQYISKVKHEILNDYPNLKSKKNLLYCPTFRNDEKLLTKKMENLINLVDYNKYNLIIKLHPLSNTEINDSRVNICKKYSSDDMLFVSDYVISDYSGIIYEAAILKKPLFFFAFDAPDYMEIRDLFIDFKSEIPGFYSEDESKIMEAINNDIYDLSKTEKFLNKYVDMSFTNNTQRISDFVQKKLQ